MNDLQEKALQNKRYFLPDLADIIFFLILYLMLYLKPDMVFADGSTAWHLVSGNYILQNGHVPHTDILSYTFADKTWVAYEWLSDLSMACLVKIGGLNLLAVVVTSAIAYLFLLLYHRCRESGCNFVFAAFLTMIGSFVSAIHWLARPHLFTFFGILIFTTQLDRYYRGVISKKKLALYLTLCMLVWANCHPGFLLGFALIGVYIVSAIIKGVFLDKNQYKELPFLSGLLALNIVASLCNPYGIELYSYISHYLFKSNNVIGITDEFLSPIFHGALQPFLLEFLFATFIIGLAINKMKIALPNLFIYLAFAHLSLSAQRNMALYVIAALPIIAGLYAHTIFSPGEVLYEKLKRPWQALIAKFDNLNREFTINEKLCSYHLVPILIFAILVSIAMNGGKVFGVEIVQGRFDENSKPEKTLITIRRLHLDPKQGLSLDNWGGIIKYKLDYPVFIDDRADFYGEDFYIEYGRMIQTFPGWQKLLDKHHINWVLLPPGNRLVDELKANKDWVKVGEDKASVLVVRKSHPAKTS